VPRIAEEKLPRSSEHSIQARFDEIRRTTVELCEPLTREDCVIQSMPDASPTKWHLAHTTWFFETFVLEKGLAGYRPFCAEFKYLFNSYYLSVGERHQRASRGLLSRPTVDEVFAYRQHVDRCMSEMFERRDISQLRDLESTLEIGVNHEQQHQELILTDIKHAFSLNPLHPVYLEAGSCETATAGHIAGEMRWVVFDEQIADIGHEGPGFAYDNESPRHRVLVPAFELASRLITNGEYQAFIDDGGYRRGELWLSLGWDAAEQGHWQAPLYWQEHDRAWHAMTLGGLKEVDPDEPVCHVSYFEADAFARWAGARLPTEQQWELASRDVPIEGNFLDGRRFHPRPAGGASGLGQMFGDAWEWTASAYLPYPGYRPPDGALGEYNGKFMCNQFVLRGGSCATPHSHIRRTYRNFFPPDARWQFTGIRLARDV